MNEKSALMAVIITAAMLGTVIVPAGAWEYWNTTLAVPITDNIFGPPGPRVDKVQINIYANEAAEFAAMEAGQIDLTDCPVDAAHYDPWTNPPLDDKIALVAQGQAFDMFILDMRLDDRLYIAPGVPNPARTAPFGNPMADVWLRRAIACVTDRKAAVMLVTGGAPPWKAKALYTPLGCAYGQWQHPQLNPTGDLAAYTYVNPDGSANIALGNQFLDDHDYTMVGGHRTKGGVAFQIQFYYRTDHMCRNAFATLIMQPLLTAAPPEGLGLDVQMIGVTSGGARDEVIDAKMGHLYTGGWGLTSDPDHLYNLFHINNYWHPGRPPNYMYYPGDANTFLAPSDGYHYTTTVGHDVHNEYDAPDLYFNDIPGHSYDMGAELWENPQNFWSWEMMISPTYDRALHCAYKSQEFLAYWVCGEPIWVSQSFTAFSRSYVGPETYNGQPWIGVVNQKGVGVGNAASIFNMHVDDPPFGSFDLDNPVTIRWGFNQQVNSLNPIYAEWASDWNVLGCCYNSLTSADPYTLADIGSIAEPNSWEIDTWPYQGETCTRIKFDLRQDIFWSDAVQLTGDDVKFSLGGPLVADSMSKLLVDNGFPPAYWSSQVADIVDVQVSLDGFTVTVGLDTYSYFGLHCMSGWNIVLPQHIWAHLIKDKDPIVTQPFGGPTVCSGAFHLQSALYSNPIILEKNPSINNVPPGSAPPGVGGVSCMDCRTENLLLDMVPPIISPIQVYTIQTSNATEETGNTHYLFPLTGDTGVNLNVSYVLDEHWAYETGWHQTDVYPYTRLGGEVNVTLKKWNGNLPCSNPANYATWGGNGTTRTFVTQRGLPLPTPIAYVNVGPGWYIVEIAINVTGLEYSVDNGSSWIPVPSAQNIFYGGAYAYRGYSLITSRYDILGAYWTNYNSINYQPVSDLRVNVKDVYACAKAFASRPGYPNWNPACDINNDYKVDVKDYYKICQNYGWTAP
jgi:ABC-type transport system substrate-binding protein